jgi:DNA-directed RNA polymerase
VICLENCIELLTLFDMQICWSDLRQPSLDHLNFDTLSQEQAPGIENNPLEVLAVEQKGLGLSSLRESLSLFSDKSRISAPEDFEGTEEEKQELITKLRQQRLEADTIRSATERWRAEFEERTKIGLDVTSGKKKVNAMMGQWHADLVAAIKTEVQLATKAEGEPVRTQEAKHRLEYGVYLRAMDAETLSAITILAVMSVFSRGGMEKGIKLSSLVAFIGREIQDELIAQAYLKKSSNADSRRTQMLQDMLAGRKGKDGRPRWKHVVESVTQEEPELNWGQRVTVRVGAVLMKLLFDVGKVSVRNKEAKSGEPTTVMQPAFLHAYEIAFGKRLGLIHVHPEIVKMIAQEPAADLIGRHLPMVCKPKPWTGVKQGGYMIYQSNIVRSTPGESLQPKYIKAAMEQNGLDEIRDGLNVLGNTGWIINRDVFDIMLEAWNKGDALASLAPLEPDLPAPPKPAADAGYEAEKHWQVQMREIENLRSGFHSVRCFQNFQLEVARAFRNETFYLPHNLDFRGRAYPLPPYLNQMGADNSRGLLLFSEAKPLGTSGLRWLKIQIANLAGFDKASMSEREQFAMDNLDNILDSANNGLHGKRWWLKAEDPWQCLAACFELRNALRCPDPTEYLSRLPIHQDGSCNGLQHYAALGGDIVGAQQVNLEPSDRPSDVYTGVSEFVKKDVEREAAEGVEIAKILEGKITRKIVKQTVMTNVYGVTFMGAMRQVRKQINDHYPELPSETRKNASLYIARKIFDALGSMFNGAHDIQYWLGDCASRITQSLTPEQIEALANEALLPKDDSASVDKDSTKLVDPTKKFRSTVIWTTPLGLPVVQPYRTRKARRVTTSLQDLNIVDLNSDDVVSRRKQLQAFPPNFIHSLDATHMILSANACNKAGLVFSAVHDSFWTHASDVDHMNRILRDAFVHLHSDDIIGRLASELNVRYGKSIFLAKVGANTPIGRAIKSMRNKRNARIKNAKLLELIDENRRQTLLRSDDPAERAEGLAMETTASLFEKMGGTDDDLIIANSLGENAVGHVPKDLAAAERRPNAAGIDSNDPAIQSLFNEVEMMDSKSTSDDPEDDTYEKPARKSATLPVWLWLPVRFRDVPKKGNWDLTRIRDSEYFFS